MPFEITLKRNVNKGDYARCRLTYFGGDNMVNYPEIDSGENGASVIVPVKIFLDVISDKTGRSHQELLTKTTIGDIEAQLDIKALKPNQMKSIKRGKSRSDYYNYISPGARKWNRELVSSLIKELNS